MSDSILTPRPMCPYCGYEYHDWRDAGEWKSGEEHELQCLGEDCAEFFIAILHNRPRFSNHKKAAAKGADGS